ncbi:MAG: PilT/PilU family type 4a pilus ATPase [Phycisphaerae bacterium]|nr:PilT/PilU family type 4a pilus ATPase [Phycisphaerae bacterium]
MSESPANTAPDPAGPRIKKYFEAMMKTEASDLHLKPGRPAYIRIRSRMTATRSGVLTSADIEEMIQELMTDKQRDRYAANNQLDMAYELPGQDRFRINVYRQRGETAVAVRRVTRLIPDFEALHLPAVMKKIADGHQGLVLLSGPTGSGKSTTIASVLQYINETRACHIVTIEDPIEFLYEDSMALINQREIGIDIESFDAALKGLMREDPDVVLIGEMRDRETFRAALQVSETGHLVFGTVHASSASQTIGRILDLFPPETRGRVRHSLAFNCRAIICQMLLPSIVDGVDLMPAVEIMLSTPSTKQLILEERDAELPDLIRASENDGMISFTRSLLTLIEKDYIDAQAAYDAAPNVDELKMMMKGISAGRGGLIGRA